MRFNCSPPQQERDKAKKYWHEYFTWFPVRVSKNERAWLETIERKGTQRLAACTGQGYPQRWWTWEYRLKPSADEPRPTSTTPE